MKKITEIDPQLFADTMCFPHGYLEEGRVVVDLTFTSTDAVHIHKHWSQATFEKQEMSLATWRKLQTQLLASNCKVLVITTEDQPNLNQLVEQMHNLQA